MKKLKELFDRISEKQAKIINIVGLVIAFSLMGSVLLGQSSSEEHLLMMQNAPKVGYVACDTHDDISFSICPYADRDTVYYSHSGIPPTHGASEVLSLIDSVIVSEFKDRASKTAIRRDSSYNLILSYEYMDGIGGSLARASYPSCNNDIVQTIKYDLYDFPPGKSTPEELKILYGDIKDIVSITKHELGHHFSIKHSNDPDDLMYPEYRKGKDWSVLELDVFDLMFNEEFFFVHSRASERITKNFRVSEYFTSCNIKDKDWHFLYSKIPIVIQIIRDRYIDPIYINSTYRNPVCNEYVGGSRASTHLQGRAVDFRFKSRDSHEKFLSEIDNKSNMYSILIKNGVTGIGLYDSHIHLDFGRDNFVLWDNRNSITEPGECAH